MKTERLNEQLIRSSFSNNDYESLLHFFQSVWLSDASYKVIIARRAFNLNYAFMDIENAQYTDEYKTENIMSNTALLLCAEEIAEYYCFKKILPSILLVDDLLIHGRGIMKLIDNLECLILDFLKGKQSEESKETIHNKLLDALNVYVFARNADGVLLDQKLSLKAVTQLSSDELRALSQQISRALQQCSVANTSYVLSAELPWTFCKEEYADISSFDDHSLFQYRGNSLCYYYKSMDNKVMETIRVYHSHKDNSLKRAATSLVIFGDVSYCQGDPNTTFCRLCQDVAAGIRQIIPYNSRIADILSYNQPYLARPRAQMLSYILSIMSYADFYREKISSDPPSLYKALLQSDYRKIAANFDRSKRIQPEIKQLFDCVSFNNSLRTSIFTKLQSCTEALNIGLGGMDSTRHDDNDCVCRWEQGSRTYVSSERLHEVAEDIFYEVGMNTEYDANQYTQTQTKFDPLTPGNDFIQFKHYLHVMKRYGVQEIPSVGCILNLMDSGLLAMNLELDSAQKSIQCILKAGELSTFVLPRRFSVFIPALSIVERNYLKKGSSKKAVIGEFIDYLQDHCYQQDGKDCKESIELLLKLKCSKGSLLYMYVTGQNFRDWDINLLTSEDRRSYGLDERGNFDAEKYMSRISVEKKQIRYYRYCAREFLRSK